MKIILWKIGNNEYPATDEDIKKFKKTLKKWHKKNKNKKSCNLVTHHAVVPHVIDLSEHS